MPLGSLPRAELVDALRARGLRTNAYGERLLAEVVVAPPAREVEVWSLAALGMGRGGTLDEVLEVAAGRGLGPCPLEAALHLRLLWWDQPEGARVTVVSPRALPDELEPRGFYLRRDADGPWLRGFVATDDWVFEPTERVVLASGSAA